MGRMARLVMGCLSGLLGGSSFVFTNESCLSPRTLGGGICVSTREEFSR